MSNRFLVGNALLLLAAISSAAQDNPSPHFEVASVKPATGSGPPSFSGGPGSSDPERITYERTTLEVLIQGAYGVLPDQISGPAWLRTETYAVTAKMPPNTTLDELRQMMVNLLAERFGLVAHHASKQVSGYNLTVMPGGPKLGSPVESTDRFAPFSQRRSDDGMMHCTFERTSMKALANRLGMVFATGQRAARGERPEFPRVVDQTGITGRFDFKLEYPAPLLPGQEGKGVDVGVDDIPGLVVEAVAKQLGLKLTPTKIDLDQVIVDHAERVPSPN